MKTRSLLFLSLAAVLLTGAGCERSSGAPDAGSGAPVPPARTADALCGNRYFPLREGYRIVYQNRFPGGPLSTYSMEVTRVSGGEATVAVDFQSGTHSEQRYRCADGGLTAIGYIDIGAGAAGRRIDTETRSSSGIFLPNDLHVGSEWSTRFTLGLNAGGAPGVPTEATVAVHHLAVAEEDVTVPAGTFRAIKVRSETDFSFGAPASPIPGLPPAAPIVGYEWWAEGKGVVKMTGGDAQDVVSEAMEIRTP